MLEDYRRFYEEASRAVTERGGVREGEKEEVGCKPYVANHPCFYERQQDVVILLALKAINCCNLKQNTQILIEIP